MSSSPSTAPSNSALPKTVRIVEVGPRDGLQNEQQAIAVDTKLTLIKGLVDAGLKDIEAGSFVNPKWVPQMAGSDELFAQLSPHPGVTYAALTPNIRGLERAIAAGVKEVALFASASESFSQKNINCSIEESLQRFEVVVSRAQEENIRLRAYVSCVVGCPYEGPIAMQQVQRLSEQLLALGCYEVSLADTIGVGTPQDITQLIEQVSKTVAVEQLALHLHDTYGQAIANAYAGLQAGISVFDASVSGLGGCPYARGATGNVATEDLVYLLEGLGIKHGINLPRLAQVGADISKTLGRKNGAKAGAALLAKSD